MTDFPFTILDVINACGISANMRGDCVYFDCPKCSGKNKVQARISSGVFNCIKCGDFKGGTLGLYQFYHSCDSKTANKAMRKYVLEPSYSEKRAQTELYARQANEIASKNSSLTHRDVINATYRRFLSLCELSESDKNNLQKRGLTEAAIKHFGFKSAPVNKSEHIRIIKTLLNEGYALKGVPGFFVNDYGHWDYNLKPSFEGMLIPYISLENKLIGFQVRLNKPLEERRNDGTVKQLRYLWFTSTDLKNGCSRSTVPHITSTRKVEKTIFFTEGALKADVASCLSGRTFVAIAGVTQYSILPTLFKQLKNSGVKRIVDCYDADYKKNPNVAKARDRLKYEVQKAGLLYYRLDWNESDGKGIDDFLLNVPCGTRRYSLFDY